MKASEIIHHLSAIINKTGKDIEIHFALDVETWYPPLTLDLFEVDGVMPEKYGVIFRLTTGGQGITQTKAGYHFRNIAALAWAKQKSVKA